MDFSTPEFEELSDLIGLIYETVIDDGAWAMALEKVCRFVGGAASRIYWRDASNSKAETVYSWGFEPHFLEIYRERYVTLNPLYPASIFISPGEIFSSRDLVPPGEFQASRFFKEWVTPQGFYDAAIFNIQRFTTSAAAFTVITGRDYGAVDERLRHRLRLLAPHLQRAAVIGREIGKQQVLSQSLASTLDRVEAGVFILDMAGKIVWTNQRAETVLRRGDLVSDNGSRMRLADAAADRLLRDGIANLPDPLDDFSRLQPAFIKMADRSGAEWTGCMMKLSPQSPTQQAFEQVGPSARAALFMRPAEIVPRSGVEACAQLYGLTPAEVRVLHQVLEIDTVAGMADSLGLSVNTVKKHLSSIFAKMAVSSRAALVKLVLAAQQ